MIDSLVRPNVKKLTPYTSARHLYQSGLFLDANENAFGSVVKVSFPLELNRYPDPYSLSLKKALAKYLNVSQDNLFVGVGSDEIIDLLIRLFVESKEEVLILEPTYGMYQVAADISGVNVKKCLLTSNFQLDLKSIRKVISQKTKLIFCCSPNNPTGNLLNTQDILKLCKAFKGIVVVDEAYIEFATQPSIIEQGKVPENLVILRTFSKAWGLAGLRVGYGIMSPKIVDYLNKIKPPYNLNVLSGYLAEQALANQDQVLRWKNAILKERERVAKGLRQLGFEVFPSEANFVLARRKNTSPIVKRLANNSGIIIRDVSSKPGLKDCVRITIGMPEQNSMLLKGMERLS